MIGWISQGNGFEIDASNARKEGMDKIVEHGLAGKLLAEVSRSFYLTLKALPSEVRETLSLAYLLARAADTLADTASAPSDLRLECLGRLREVVKGGDVVESELQLLLSKVQADFMPLQSDEGELRLLQKLSDVVRAYRALPEFDRAMTWGVLEPIIHGQMLDIERFPTDGQLRALATAEELDEYTWLVAGCVGDFWTKLCDAKMGKNFAGDISVERMVERGIKYGKGLQLVNILRDVAKDAKMGRCYLPLEEIQSAGLTMEQVGRDQRLLWPLRKKWLELAESYLDAGLEYVELLQSKRLRYATALPLLLGYRTLALLQKATEQEWLAAVKVPRGEVTKLLFETGIASATRGGIGKLAAKLRS